ncbi:MAG TPA: hypothetical protein ENF81_11125 [Thermotogaceae bacterium]|nr:hypothetical protein [Thermotogaceae bacterium]
MSSRSRIIFLFSILAFFSLSFSNAGHIYGVGSQELEITRIEYLLNGKVIPFSCEPISAAQLSELLKKIPNADERLKKSVKNELNSKGLKMFFKLSPMITSNNWDYTLPSTYVDLEEAYRYYSLPSSIDFGGEINISDNFYGLIDVDLKREFSNFYIYGNESNVPHITSDLGIALNGNIPDVGFFGYQSENIGFRIGRQKLKWGPGERGLLLSDASPYYDSIGFRFSTKGRVPKQLNYSFEYIGIDPHLTDEEFEIQSDSTDAKSRIIYNDRYKTLIAHRLDFLFFDSFRIGISELNLVGGKIPDLRCFSPLILFHNNYYFGFTNIMGGLDFSYSPFKNFELYGEIAIDDIKLPSEQNNLPNAYGLLFGAQYGNKLLSFYTTLTYEFVYTSDYIYNRNLPYLKFTNRFYNLSLHPRKESIIDFPMGFYLGPDSISHYLKLRLINPPKFSSTFSLEYLSKGPYTTFNGLVKLEDEKIRETNFKISTDLTFRELFFKWLNLNLSANMQLIGNPVHFDNYSEYQESMKTTELLFDLRVGLNAEWGW